MGQKVLCQGNGHIGGGFAPVIQLRGEDNHFIVVFRRLCAEVLRHICADALKIQSFPAGQCNKQRIRLAAVVAFRDVAAVVDVAVFFRMQNIVIQKSALHLCADGDVRRCCGGCIRLFSRLGCMECILFRLGRSL